MSSLLAMHARTDEEGIRKTVAEYCRCYDDRAFDRFEDIWTARATMITGSATTHGRQEIRRYVETLPLPRPALMHCFVNLVIDIAGATAETACDYFALGVRNAEIKIVSGGRIEFTLAKEPDRWRIARMEFKLHLNQEVARQRQAPSA